MVELVLRSANLLRVDEFEVFRLADRYWQNQAIDVKAAFIKYLDQKIVPPWVLHFSRSVVTAYERGDFEPAMFGVYPSYETINIVWALAFRAPCHLTLSKSCDLLVA